MVPQPEVESLVQFCLMLFYWPWEVIIDGDGWLAVPELNLDVQRGPLQVTRPRQSLVFLAIPFPHAVLVCVCQFREFPKFWVFVMNCLPKFAHTSALNSVLMLEIEIVEYIVERFDSIQEIAEFLILVAGTRPYLLLVPFFQPR